MKLKKIRPFMAVTATLATFAFPLSAMAFQVLPKISDVDRKLATLSNNRVTDGFGQWIVGNALPMIKNPVHEAITLNALDCSVPAGEERNCVNTENVLQHQTLLYGVRWPDDPPFALNKKTPPRIAGCDVDVTLRSTAQPKCWTGLFNDASSTAQQRALSHPDKPAFGPGDYLLYRSHFGDLQFFHSMATHDGETAQQTRDRMKMWAEFLWGIGNSSIRTDVFIPKLGNEQLTRYFPGEWTATNLFATGIVKVRKDLDQVAIGALLHMVQDSFSQAHAARNQESGVACEDIPRFAQPGTISQFYSYAQQAGNLHDHEDTFRSLGKQTLQSSSNVVEVSRSLLTLWKEKAPWSEAEKYFDCVFALENESAPAGPGPFVKVQRETPTNWGQ